MNDSPTPDRPDSPEVNPFASPQTIDSEPIVEALGETAHALRGVAQGLSVLYYGICTCLLSIIFGVGFAFLVGSPAVAMLIALGMIVGYALILVGLVMCLKVPRNTGAHGFAAAAVILIVVQFLTTVSSAISAVRMAGLVAYLLGVAITICFVLFLRQLARFIERNDLMNRATIVIGLGIVGVFLTVFFSAVTAVPEVLESGGEEFILGGFAVGSLICLVAFVMFANLVNSLRKLLTNVALPDK